ncbi:MAG: ferrous iron transport protein A [Oscillospiraceae bacterium]|nr:ferrous iron transport protein A [Oscillospiraceae bacterium]
MPLDRLEIGKSALILSVGGENKLRCRLLDMGFVPGTEVSLRRAAPMGDPLEIALRG